LIACTFTCYICVLTMQSGNQFVVPPILLREHCRYCLRKTEKAGPATVFFCIGIIKFNLAKRMMFSFHIAFVFNKIYIYIYIYILGRICRIFFLAYQILHVFSHDISIIWVLIYFA
jgi:hypothetical protein